MRRRFNPFAFVSIILILSTLACNLGGSAVPGAAETAAAGTVVALLTQSAGTFVAPLPTEPPVNQSTETPVTPEAQKPSDTPGPTNTPGVQGCIDDADFVADVTIPDNTAMAPGTTITKTWRVKNSGTCTWVSAYLFTRVSGEAMGSPASVAVTGNVAPGSLYEVSVNFTAPMTPGTYRSTWQLKNAGGALFGTKPYVQIVVPSPSATPTASPTLAPTGPVTVTLNAAANSGGVVSPPGSVFNATNVGDDSGNASRQAFVTFDLSSIPSGATVSAVRLDLSSHDQLGMPFNLGCLRGYQQNFGTLDGSDYFSGTELGALWRFCDAADLADPADQALAASNIAIVQTALASGQFQIRLQFNDFATNGNNGDDLLRPTPKLMVTYTVP